MFLKPFHINHWFKELILITQMVSLSLKFPLDQVCVCISYVLWQENKYFGDTKVPAVKCKLPSMQERPWKLLCIVVFFHNVSNERTEVYDCSSVFLFLCVHSLYWPCENLKALNWPLEQNEMHCTEQTIHCNIYCERSPVPEISEDVTMANQPNVSIMFGCFPSLLLGSWSL